MSHVSFIWLRVKVWIRHLQLQWGYVPDCLLAGCSDFLEAYHYHEVVIGG